jgi:hypothetical protein
VFDRKNHHIIELRNVKFEEGLDKERIVIRDEDDDEDWTENQTLTEDEGDEGNRDEPDDSGGEIDMVNHRVASPIEENSENPETSPPPPLRHSTRIRHPPTPDDAPKYFVDSRKKLMEPAPPVNHSKDNETEIVDHAALMSTLEPQSYHDAMQCEDASSWMDAMAKEMESQNKAEMYIEVPRPDDVNILESQWVYAYKLRADSQNIIYKA